MEKKIKFTQREKAAINQYMEMQKKNPEDFEKVRKNLMKIWEAKKKYKDQELPF